MKQHDQPVALITGAAHRIGAALASDLHQAGFRVVVHYHHSEAAAQQQVLTYNQSRANSAIALRADLCSLTTIPSLIDTVLAQWGRLDLLINNASIFSKCDSDSESMWRCNVQAPYQLSWAAFPHLEATQGSIINITDIHAHTPLRDYAIYCQTKAALAMQTRALAQQFAPNVRVNAIAPGAIMWPEADNQLQPMIQEKIISKTLVKRHGSPQYIAQAMMYLVTNQFVTGQSLQVDGGRYL